MTIDRIFVIIFGFLGIVFIYWFFFGKKDQEVEVASDAIDIKVEGGYSPSTISVKKGKTVKLNFTRTDSNTCLEEVILSDFKIKKYLPLNKKITIEITPQKSGKFDFTCGMNMFHGKLIVS